jgi:F-type H+-transporting ATPase subunit epsilon
MANLMRFEVLAPDKYVLKSDEVSYVGAETTGGGVGILAKHANMICALKEGPLKYRDAHGKSHYICVDGGFLEVRENKVTILTEAAETVESINIERAQASEERAATRLKKPDQAIDLDRVMRSMRRARARLKTVQVASRDKD